MVTRRPEQSAGLAALLAAAGAKIIELPCIEIVDPPTWGPLDDSIRKLVAGHYEWVAFTSANGAMKFLGRLGCSPDEVFDKVKVAAVGTATKELLVSKGITVDLTPASFTAPALAEALGTGTGRVLLPRAAETPPEMTELLVANGWTPHEVAAYRTVPGTPDPVVLADARSGGFDVVTFTSASTVAGFCALVPPAAVGLEPPDPPDRLVGCIGPVTARACSDHGMRVDVVAEVHTNAGLVEALADLAPWDANIGG
jgi:uroporphyrinogen III methyltransferase/synthase